MTAKAQSRANEQDLLLILSADSALIAAISAILRPVGWKSAATADRECLLALLAEHTPIALLLDDRAPQAGETLAAVRQLPVPLNGTPVLTIGPGSGSAMGAGGRIGLPLGEAELLTALRQWAGPLDDRALRAAPWNFHYRLIRLLGFEAADAMLGNLAQMLEEAVAAQDPDTIPSHRIAGLAGMCGLTELSRCWSRVDRGEDDALAPAIEASRAAAAQLAQRPRG